LLAARELFWITVRKTLKAHQPDRLVDLPQYLGAAKSARLQSEGDVLRDTQVRKQA
jgi:hypothetical protein